MRRGTDLDVVLALDVALDVRLGLDVGLDLGSLSHDAS